MHILLEEAPLFLSNYKLLSIGAHLLTHFVRSLRSLIAHSLRSFAQRSLHSLTSFVRYARSSLTHFVRSLACFALFRRLVLLASARKLGKQSFHDNDSKCKVLINTQICSPYCRKKAPFLVHLDCAIACTITF